MTNRRIEYSKVYGKELAALVENGKINTSNLDRLLSKLCRGENLDPQYRDHQLSRNSTGEYKGCREFHYKPNICVVYRRTDNSIKLLRVGPHNRLGLTEKVRSRIDSFCLQ